MLMNRLASQQEFLPTNLVSEAPFWYYAISVPLILVGVWLMLAVSKNGKESRIRGGIGGTLFAIGAVVFAVSLFGGDVPDTKQNHANFVANVKSVYSVDEVTLLDYDLDNGDTIKVHADGRTYEVIANWDPETFEPTLYPTTVEIEDLEALKNEEKKESTE